MGVLIRSCILIAAAVAGVAPAAIRLQAQGVSTPELTAAFLFNFVKFTTWPEDALRAGGQIFICVSSNDQVAQSLAELAHNKMAEGHSVVVRRTVLNQPLKECHVVYAASLDATRARELVLAVSGLPILTVSDLEDFARRGGMANFFIDSGRMRFAVNPDAAERARLRISSRLLALSRVVRDDRNR
jgi:hypothetical protein